MKIRVIGSGSMWTKYNSACYLIDDDIIVDFPNGACKYLYRFNISPYNINHVLLTHFHGDHYFDIPFYILNKSKSNNQKVYIYCSPNGRSKIDQLGILAFPNSFDEACDATEVDYNFNDNFSIHEYKVSKLLVDHGRMKPAYGFMFEKDNYCVGFTGDTSTCDSVEMMASKCNYLFCDCMLEKGNNKHMGINNLEYLTDKYKNCVFVVSHLEDSTRTKLEKLNINNLIVPNDGQVIKVGCD